MMCCGLVPRAHSARLLEVLSLQREVQGELPFDHFRYLLGLAGAHHVTELCIQPYKEVQHAPINVHTLQHIWS